MASEDAQEPQHDARSSQDTEAHWDTSDTDPDGILTIDVEGLSGPEHENGEKVGTRDEGDHQSHGEYARFLLQTRGKHGVLGAFHLPNDEPDEEKSSEEERDQNMGGFP